jgi:lysophospholipase L1-like esterase
MPLIRLLAVLFVFPALALHAAPAPAPTEFHARGGLPNVAARIARGDEVRVAVLGGSITAAAGWRVFILEHLRRTYPAAKFIEINAAVSGTGSNYGATRLQRDVLRHRPDLVFVEFAVNDGAGSPRVEAQMEGIVRQTWASRPSADLCFVYTVNENHLPDLARGSYQSTALVMERVAAHYGIPSFNFGVEIARRAADGTLVFTAPAAEKADPAGNDARGRLIFTRDRTHPTEAGHRIYAARFAAALPAFLAAGQPGDHRLPAPRRDDHWGAARLVTVSEVHADDQWQAVPPGDPHLTTQSGENLVPPLLVAFEPGAKIEFRFNGTVLGLIGLKGPENGRFRVTVDDLESETGTLFDSFSSPGRFYLKPWFFSKTLPPGEHRVRLELLDEKIDKAAIMAKAGTPITDPKPFAAHGLYFGGFLIVGEPVGTKPPAPERTAAFTALDRPVVPTPPPGYRLVW